MHKALSHPILLRFGACDNLKALQSQGPFWVLVVALKSSKPDRATGIWVMDAQQDACKGARLSGAVSFFELVGATLISAFEKNV